MPDGTSLPADFTPELLNSLYRQHEDAPSETRSAWLGQELTKHGLAASQRRLEEAFAGVLGAGYVFLDTYPGGAVDSDVLWQAHDAEIRRYSPWLNDENFRRACDQSRYYAWHDGLVKSKGS